MEEVKNGAFVGSLKRNNKQIRDDRAAAIARATQVKYSRSIEDIELKIEDYQRDLENMLDLSPSDATSLKLATDFDAAAFIEKDQQIRIKIRNEKIKLEEAVKGYEYLFGPMTNRPNTDNISGPNVEVKE